MLLGFCLAHILVNDERFRELPFNRKYGVKACHGLLEYNGDIVTSYLVHLFEAELCKVLAFKEYFTAGNVAVAVEELEHAHS